ncbi:phage replication protein O%2C N-terminal domain [Yersinia pseudotuberculosis]|uniref:replication protein n=1 Tax=Yersinia pseudotuberculosis TaxID=633 RepID=UPI0005E40B62|nr:replication protein [Yersinia pseudotuberculosis]AYX14002.1 DNA replication protein [Yersinia pseudotuberculosis]PSH28797.1 hypothetical protein BLA51_17060 [Yersinia pseudotuberculosis]CNH75165.1 phage replication protein O%2C N-terminal domain [Yersinia pseudotuberculosis]CNL19826.1 phage replication protein O%2C N-terminal domain [Yersinia pseudotuberculosis]
MSNAIDYNNNVSPIRPHLEVVECRVADTSDGFIMLAMELYEELIGANLTKNQAKVVHAVCRKTYGYKKKMDRIADSQLAILCRISREKVCTARNELIEMKVILSDGRKIGPNKNISEWKIPVSTRIGNIVTKKDTKTVTDLVTPTVTELDTHKRNTLNKKETTPKSPEGTLVEKDKPKAKQPASSKFTFDRERFKETWNQKANKHGLPRIVSISTTTEKGLKRLYESHLKHCKETKRIPRDMDTFINGYIEFGYTPSSFAMGENPAGKKYGIDTALTQRIIDQVISQEA